MASVRMWLLNLTGPSLTEEILLSLVQDLFRPGFLTHFSGEVGFCRTGNLEAGRVEAELLQAMLPLSEVQGDDCVVVVLDRLDAVDCCVEVLVSGATAIGPAGITAVGVEVVEDPLVEEI